MVTNPKEPNMPLTQIQINSLNALFSAMDKPELDEVLDMLLEEAFRREWEPLIVKEEA